MKPVLLSIHMVLLLSVAQLAAPARAADDLPCGAGTVSQAVTGKQWITWLKARSDEQSWFVALCNYLITKHENTNLKESQKLGVLHLLKYAETDLNRDFIVREILLPFHNHYPYLVKLNFEKAVDKGYLKFSDPTAFDLYTIAKQQMNAEKRALSLQEKKAIESGNGNDIGSISLGWFAVGEFKRAADLARTALRLGVRDVPRTQLTLGISLAFAGDPSGAQAEFKKIRSKGREQEIADFWILYLKIRSK